MRLIVGLGNPGRRYDGTRHNVGFEVVQRLATEYGQGGPKLRFHAETMDADILGVRALLLRPLTYMNRSGRSVQAAVSFFKLQHEEMLIICDDINLPTARLRFRARGSSGGQNGLADIIEQLGTEEFPRLRIGIGSPPPGRDACQYVLSRFTEEESDNIRQAIEQARDGVRDWSTQGIEYCMNQYNAS